MPVQGCGRQGPGPGAEVGRGRGLVPGVHCRMSGWGPWERDWGPGPGQLMGGGAAQSPVQLWGGFPGQMRGGGAV
jgi:hypothetical protein